MAKILDRQTDNRTA